MRVPPSSSQGKSNGSTSKTPPKRRKASSTDHKSTSKPLKEGGLPTAPGALVGRTLLKDFFDKDFRAVRPFEGRITKYFKRENWYYVEYEDGDAEDLRADEVVSLILRAEEAQRLRDAVNPPQPVRPKRSTPVVKGMYAENEDSSSSEEENSSEDEEEKAKAKKQRRSDISDETRIGKPANGRSTPNAKQTPSKPTLPKTTKQQQQQPQGTPKSATPKSQKKAALLSSPKPPSQAQATPTRALVGGKAEIPVPGYKQLPTGRKSVTPLPSSSTLNQPPKKKTPIKRKKPAPVSKEASTEAAKHNDSVLHPVKERVKYYWRPGTEPWRKLKLFDIEVNEAPILDAKSRSILAECKRMYYREYRQAEEGEATRVDSTVDKDGRIGFAEDGTRLAKRPDRVTESRMKNLGYAINQDRRVGHIPGVHINQRFYSRAELSCMGMHKVPVAGIDTITARPELGLPPLAVSVVCSGWYEDDTDTGDELIFTGEGGNDLLGRRKQVADQKMERGNRALVGNIQLGLPVRVVRKNKDPQGLYGCVLIFDGLYDVVEYWKQKGKEDKFVFQFRLVRRPDQGPLLSKMVKWGGISAPKKISSLSRPGIVDTDISGGLESIPIPAVNECEDDDDLPPCTDLARVPEEAVLHAVLRGISHEALAALKASNYKPSVQYVTDYQYAAGIELPSAPVLPAEFRNNPHEYIKQLNHGRLPYLESKRGKVLQLREALPVVYECGPWCGCIAGDQCPQAATQGGLRYRLEVFKTSDGRGWGVRSLDMIPQFAYISTYYGDVFRSLDYDKKVEDENHDGAYSMDMAVRPDRDWEGNFISGSSSVELAEYVICGLHRRNVSAFMNHSCSPNCFVQPVLSHHHDLKMPKVAIFASEDIAPFTQLTLDYGQDYVSMKFEEGCKCGAEDCVSRQGNGGTSTDEDK